MRSQEFYQAMTEAFEDIIISPPQYTEFVVSQTKMDKIVGEAEGFPIYTIISSYHLKTINWITIPPVLYSTSEGSYSKLQQD